MSNKVKIENKGEKVKTTKINTQIHFHKTICMPYLTLGKVIKKTP